MRMTVGQLRRIIRETIEEERRHSMNEGFMDSVKGLFGGGTKGAAKAYNDGLFDIIMNNSIKGTDASAWWEAKQHVEKVLGREIARKLEKIMDSSVDQASAAGFLSAVTITAQNLFKNPSNFIGQVKGDDEQFISGAEALEKGDKRSASSTVKYLLGRDPYLFYDAFKKEPQARKYVELAGEADHRGRVAQQNVELGKEHEAWKKKKEKEAERAEIEREWGNRRQAKEKEEEARRDRSAELRFRDEREKEHEKNWGKKTSERYAD